MTFFCLCVLCMVSVATAIDCTGVDDGHHETGCKTYVECDNGTAYLIECPGSLVYDRVNMISDDPAQVGAPCGLYRDCSMKDDGLYPELYHDNVTNHCTSFYSCNDSKYLGHNYCPAGLVFDVKQQICNRAEDTCPPCGTSTTDCTDTLLG